MAGESSEETTQDQAESLVDELISDIFKESGKSETSVRGMATAATLLESAFGTTRGSSRMSVVERLFLAEAFASELADALAPALAERIAPRLIKALEQYIADDSAAKKPTQTQAGRSSSPGRKTETK